MAFKKLSQSFQRKTTVQVTPAEFRKRTPKELLSSRHALPRNHLALVGGRRGWTCVLIIFGVATATCWQTWLVKCSVSIFLHAAHRVCMTSQLVLDTVEDHLVWTDIYIVQYLHLWLVFAIAFQLLLLSFNHSSHLEQLVHSLLRMCWMWIQLARMLVAQPPEESATRVTVG